jgi:hypothetical protein
MYGDHGFDHTCWKSANKNSYLGFEGTDGLGYDLAWHDTHGLLVKPGQECLIEVKASSGQAESFPISMAEWERAKAAHCNPKETYMIIRVVDTLTSPRITDILIDPVSLEKLGKLRLENLDGLIKPGRPLG